MLSMKPSKCFASALVLMMLCQCFTSTYSDLWTELGLPAHLPGLVNKIMNPINKKPSRNHKYPAASSKLSLETLRFVYVLARHGSRSPLFTHPTDPYPYTDERYWPDGPGHLTKYGKQQEFEVGERLRSRYGGFLGANYSPNETKILSNPCGRDFETAACLAAGLYPPVGYQIWNHNLLWNPVIIEYDMFDAIKLFSKDVCPGFMSEALSRISKLDSQSYKYKKIIEHVARHSGVKDQLISQMARIYDTLYMQELNGLSLPDWTKAVYPDPLKFFFIIVFNTLFVGSENTIQMTGGPVLGKVWERLRDKSRGDLKPNLRLELLAGHDSTIRTVLSALDVDQPYFIHTSAYLVFELHENSHGHFVQVLYFNSSSSEKGEVVEVPRCTSSACPLAEFEKVAASSQIESWNQHCLEGPTVDEEFDHDYYSNLVIKLVHT